MLSSSLSRDQFNPDDFGELRADPEAGVANLANDVAVPADQANLLLLAKPKLAQTMIHLGAGGKLLDADGGAGADLAQRTKKRTGARPLGGGVGVESWLIHCGEP
jgi:hypothetical protein